MNTVAKVMDAINHQLKVCDELWKMEFDERIELSDGPDMDEEEMVRERGGREREGRGNDYRWRKRQWMDEWRRKKKMKKGE